jgi:Zn-dependent protease
MGDVNFTWVSVLTVVFQVLMILFSLSVHESAHAWMASKLGDDTGRMLGRITLNPIPHIDPLGTVILPAVMAFLGLPIFGWAKPVPVISRNFKHLRRDEAFVGAAGPASNLIITLFCTLLLAVLLLIAGPASFWLQFESSYSVPWWILQLALINLILATFNLIPIPPLDGSWVLSALLPLSVHRFYEQIRRFGPILLLVLFFTPLLKFILMPLIKLSYAVFIHLPLSLLSTFL